MVKNIFRSNQMRKLLVSLFVCVLVLAFATSSLAVKTGRHGRDNYIGGTKSVDNIPYATLIDPEYVGHICEVNTSAGVKSWHVWNIASSASENSPFIIKPDDSGANPGRWELMTGIIMGRTATQAWAMRDSDCTDFDINTQIDMNCTGTGTNAEECEVYVRGQTGGILTLLARFIAPETETFTDDANLDIKAPVVLLAGDNDTNSDTLDLQDGDFPGQTLNLIASANIDTDDTVTIAMTDTTCTNCPAIVFNFIGENAVLTWTGTTWVVNSLVDDYS
jgi:hypothetical protein